LRFASIYLQIGRIIRSLS